MKNKEETEFEDLVKLWRETKIELDIIAEKEKSLKEQIKQIVEENNLEKGSYYGMKLTYREKFLEYENKKLAKDNEIEIPTKIKTDLKALKKIFKELQISAFYSRTPSISLDK